MPTRYADDRAADGDSRRPDFSDCRERYQALLMRFLLTGATQSLQPLITFFLQISLPFYI